MSTYRRHQICVVQFLQTLFSQHKRKLIELDIARAIRINLIDQLLNINSQPKVMLDYLYRRISLHMTALVRSSTISHKCINRIILIV